MNRICVDIIFKDLTYVNYYTAYSETHQISLYQEIVFPKICIRRKYGDLETLIIHELDCLIQLKNLHTLNA